MIWVFDELMCGFECDVGFDGYVCVILGGLYVYGDDVGVVCNLWAY